jgi:hypothetical protein
MASGEWSDEENAAIVADYFGMLALELAGKPYSKSERNRSLQSLTGRGRGSIEYKHQNISAIPERPGRNLDRRLQARLQLPASAGNCRHRLAGHAPGLANASAGRLVEFRD